MMAIPGTAYNKLREALTANKGEFLHLKLKGGGGQFQGLVGLTIPAIMEVFGKEEAVPDKFVEALKIVPATFVRGDDFRAHMTHHAKRAGWPDEGIRALQEELAGCKTMADKQEAAGVHPPAPARPSIPTPAEIAARKLVDGTGAQLVATPKTAGIPRIESHLNYQILIRFREDGVIELRREDDPEVLKIPEKSGRGDYHGVGAKFECSGKPGILSF